MGDSNNNSGKVDKHESESNYLANSSSFLLETSAHEATENEMNDKFAGAEIANLERSIFDVKLSIACQEDDNTMPRSICSGNDRSPVSMFGVSKEEFSDGESSIKDYEDSRWSSDSFLCKAVLFRRHNDSPREYLRFAWYIINAKNKPDDESIGRFIEYEKDHHRCSLDGYMTFRFKDFLHMIVSHHCTNNEFCLCGEDERMFTKEYFSENSKQEFLGPIQWCFERNPDALGIGNCEFTFMFKTAEDYKSFKKIITTYCGQPNPEAIAFATPMTPDDKLTIQVCFARLVKLIRDPGKVSRLLYQWSILTSEEQNNFCKGDRKKKVMLLLLLIPKRGNVLPYLIDALQNSEKQELAAKLLRENREKIHQGEIKFEEPFPMPDADKKELQKRFVHLTSFMSNKKDILAEMYSRLILSDDKIETIMGKKKRREKAEEIIWAAMSHGRRLSDFVAILRCTENKNLSKLFNAHHMRSNN